MRMPQPIRRKIESRRTRLALLAVLAVLVSALALKAWVPSICSVGFAARVIHSIFPGRGFCAALPHEVFLKWNASTSPGVAGYLVSRGERPSGPFIQLTPSPVPATSYTDKTVQSGRTYYYAVQSVDAAGNRSAYSNQTVAEVPHP